jgi:hypothetical protein
VGGRGGVVVVVVVVVEHVQTGKGRMGGRGKGGGWKAAAPRCSCIAPWARFISRTLPVGNRDAAPTTPLKLEKIQAPISPNATQPRPVGVGPPPASLALTHAARVPHAAQPVLAPTRNRGVWGPSQPPHAPGEGATACTAGNSTRHGEV